MSKDKNVQRNVTVSVQDCNKSSDKMHRYCVINMRFQVLYIILINSLKNCYKPEKWHQSFIVQIDWSIQTAFCHFKEEREIIDIDFWLTFFIEVVDAPLLEVSKTSLDGTLNNVVQGKMSLPMEGVFELDDF